MVNFAKRDNEQPGAKKMDLKETWPRARLFSAHLKLVKQKGLKNFLLLENNNKGTLTKM